MNFFAPSAAAPASPTAGTTTLPMLLSVSQNPLALAEEEAFPPERFDRFDDEEATDPDRFFLLCCFLLCFWRFLALSLEDALLPRKLPDALLRRDLFERWEEEPPRLRLRKEDDACDWDMLLWVRWPDCKSRKRAWERRLGPLRPSAARLRATWEEVAWPCSRFTLLPRDDGACDRAGDAPRAWEAARDADAEPPPPTSTDGARPPLRR